MPRKSQARLTDEARAFVVEQLAAYSTPVEVTRMVKERFGFDISPQGIEAYDPSKWAGRNILERWRVLFEKARKAYLEDIDSVPESYKAVRIKRLSHMARNAESKGNMVLAAQLLEQIAKECGDAFTNQRKTELTGKNGGPVQVEAPKLEVVLNKA